MPTYQEKIMMMYCTSKTGDKFFGIVILYYNKIGFKGFKIPQGTDSRLLDAVIRGSVNMVVSFN